MQRHLEPLLHAALDDRRHEPRGEADDLRRVRGDREPEVLEQIDRDGLHLDHPAQNVTLVSPMD